MGNSKSDEEFYEHFKFLAKDLYRITMPGRLLSFHCMDLPLMKERDGVIGLKDFPAIIRQVFEDCGFIYHSKVTIWKNPVTEMQRTKALGLLHKQIRKDSTMCRQGLPDYIVTMRKPGENPEPIAHPDGFTRFIGENEPDAPKKEPELRDSRVHKNISLAKEDPVYSHQVWRRYASPVWMDIRQTYTLQYKTARDEKDERHICPLQLDVIARQFLWHHGVDYDHGTGHGIGSYLSVHEGPQRIAKTGHTPLEIGMMLSNEPGYYKQGSYGIRIENLILVESRTIPGGDREMMGFETLTFSPIDLRLVEPSCAQIGRHQGDYHTAMWR